MPAHSGGECACFRDDGGEDGDEFDLHYPLTFLEGDFLPGEVREDRFNLTPVVGVDDADTVGEGESELVCDTGSDVEVSCDAVGDFYGDAGADGAAPVWGEDEVMC